MIGNIIVWLIIGVVVGALARLVLPGRQSISWVATIVIGIIAAFVGGLISYSLIGVDDNGGIQWIPLIISVALAAVGVSLYAGSAGRRTVGHH
ncbi:GlsB/YeaQ/YmgE family stress response membrane protein [Luteipulveratus mongoliensis]|uniref:Transglycosylase n=1 Tax=Luteipulveratus mongoliensis TaxID=571913 RepID=A0A0K1JEQ0_9MICO|nr:hypothetical protein [Luteipulveratus mongoliensis]AKU15179.1 hypothetical protein VV02_03740 [Luteipulveratus mongoliensis]